MDIMRYRINKNALLCKMAEYGQNKKQQIAYLQHNIATLMENKHFAIFNTIAVGYNIYYMLLNQAFELIRLNFYDYLIVIQADAHNITIEIRKKS